MFKKYDENTFTNIFNQLNIFVLVGNGFDISVLRKYNQGKMKGKTTSYSDFYDYITYFNLSDDSNILYKKMIEDKANNKENWSDFENTIAELLDDKETNIKELEKCVDEFQDYFTRFLNDLVDTNTLLALNKDVIKNELSKQSLQNFSNDLGKLDFIKRTKHYDLFYYVFANLNYTSLLDNYIYMDKLQFDPHPYKTIDTNFSFIINQKYKNTSPTIWSSYLMYEVLHLHGFQDVPRSILFGVDIPDYDAGTAPQKRLIKSYLSQYEAKYKSYIDTADLFIIYGMSLGKTDAWWLDKIYDAILSRGVELIIYKYGNKKEEDVKQMFIDSCIRHSNSKKSDIDKVKEKIFVVTFNDNNTYFLGLEKKV